MYCDRCGTEITQTQTFCSSCGKAVRAVPPAGAARGRVEGHVRLLSILWMAYSALRLLGGWFVSTFLAHFFEAFGRGFLNPPLPFFLPGLMRVVGVFVLAGGVLGLAAGWGLMERQPWARMLAIVIAFCTLVPLGIGTALGIYTLWVLLPEESAREYQGIARVV